MPNVEIQESTANRAARGKVSWLNAVMAVGLAVSMVLLALAAYRRLTSAGPLRVEWSPLASQAVQPSAQGTAGDAENASSVVSAVQDASAGADDSLLAGLPAAVARRGDAWESAALDRRGASSEVAAAGAEQVVPRSRRWQIYFDEGLTEGVYAQQLDSFGIELGVLFEGGKIEYISQLAQAMPTRRQGLFQDEGRMYLSWRKGELAAADRGLAAKAGLDVGARIVLHFLPEAVEDKLAEVERKFRDRPESAIQRTRFGVRLEGGAGNPGAGAYEFYVIEQDGTE